MTCPKCKSNNVTVSTVGNVKKRGILPCWYWLCCVWLVDIVCFGAIARHLKGNIHTQMVSYGNCQDCGYSWKTK